MRVVFDISKMQDFWELCKLTLTSHIKRLYYVVLDRHVFNQMMDSFRRNGWPSEWPRPIADSHWTCLRRAWFYRRLPFFLRFFVFLKIVRRVDLFEPVKFMIISILLLFSWSLNIRQNEFTRLPSFISLSIPMKSIIHNICPLFRLALSILKGGTWKSVENAREKYPLLPVFVHAQWGKSKRKWDSVIKAYVVYLMVYCSLIFFK